MKYLSTLIMKEIYYGNLNDQMKAYGMTEEQIKAVYYQKVNTVLKRHAINPAWRFLHYNNKP